MKASASIIDHLNGQKEIMMGVNRGTALYSFDIYNIIMFTYTFYGFIINQYTGMDGCQLPQFNRLPRFLQMKTDHQGLITPSTVAQKHVCIRHEGAYTVEKAFKLFSTTEELGFGKVVEIETPVSRRCVNRLSARLNDVVVNPSGPIADISAHAV